MEVSIPDCSHHNLYSSGVASRITITGCTDPLSSMRSLDKPGQTSPIFLCLFDLNIIGLILRFPTFQNFAVALNRTPPKPLARVAVVHDAFEYAYHFGADQVRVSFVGFGDHLIVDR